MDFVQLPEHFSCSFLGVNSPIILRAEAGCDDGGMVVEEYRNTVPNVHLYGDTPAAREQFGRALHSMREFVESMETPPTMFTPDNFPYVCPTFFQVEIRRPTYRATLWGDAKAYDFSWVVADGEPLYEHRPYVGDFRDAYERLKALYERFFNTTL